MIERSNHCTGHSRVWIMFRFYLLRIRLGNERNVIKNVPDQSIDNIFTHYLLNALNILKLFKGPTFSTVLYLGTCDLWP